MQLVGASTEVEKKKLFGEYSAAASVLPLPAARTCAESVCTFLGDAKPKCAYSFNPHVPDTPLVVDWMDNTTTKQIGHGWKDEVGVKSSGACLRAFVASLLALQFDPVAL
jgi:hypothetical protein